MKIPSRKIFSTLSFLLWVLPASAMEPPASVAPSAKTDTSITWSWTDLSSDELGYRVLNSAGVTNLSGDLPANTGAWNQLGLTPNTLYQVNVQAFNLEGTSTTLSGTFATNPRPPINSILISVGLTSVSASWSTNGNPAGTEYEVQLTVVGGASSETETTSNSISLGSLVPDTNYSLRVRAHGVAGDFSGYDTTLNFKTLAALAAPTNVRAADRSDTSILWAWTDPNSTELGYRVLNAAASVNLSGDLPANSLQWNQGGLTPNTLYQVNVQAFNSTESGTAPSPQIATEPRLPLDTEIIAVGLTNVTAAWTANGNPPGTTYEVQLTEIGGASSNINTTAISIAIPNLKVNTNYSLRVRVHAVDGDFGPYDDTVNFRTKSVLVPPSSVFVSTSNSTSILWGWIDSNGDETGYRVRKGSTLESLSGDLPINETTWIDTGLTPNTSYSVFVEAFDATASTRATVPTTGVTAPNSPDASEFIYVGISSVGVNWQSNQNPLYTTYETEVREQGGATVIIPSLTDSLVVNDLKSNTTYFFRVRAVGITGIRSSFDNQLVAKTLGAPDIPPNVSIGTSTTNSILWNWTENNELETGIRVLAANTLQNISGDLPPNTTFWLQTGLTPNASSQIIVEPFNQYGSTRSAVTIGFTHPNRPVNLQATEVGGIGVVLGWQANGNPAGTNYRVVMASGTIFAPPFSFFDSATLSRTVTGLKTGNTYTFQVWAVGPTGLTLNNTQNLTVTTIAGMRPPSTITAVTQSSITITWGWSDLNGSERGYRVFDSLGQNISGNLPANTVSFRQTGLTPKTSYQIFVEVFDSFESSRSAISPIEATTPEPQLNSGPQNISELGGNVSLLAPHGIISIDVPAQAFNGPVFMTIQAINSFNCSPSPRMSLVGTGQGIQVDISPAGQPAREVSIRMHYEDWDVIGLDENKLVLARCDETHHTWVPLPTTPNPDQNYVTAKTNHFSVFQLMAAQTPRAIGDAIAFPNPLRPSRGHTSMTFSNMPAQATIRVYTVLGELVREVNADNVGQAVWNGDNEDGTKVSSGVYYVVVDGDDDHRTLTVAVER